VTCGRNFSACALHVRDDALEHVTFAYRHTFLPMGVFPTKASSDIIGGWRQHTAASAASAAASAASADQQQRWHLASSPTFLSCCTYPAHCAVRCQRVAPALRSKRIRGMFTCRDGLPVVHTPHRTARPSAMGAVYCGHCVCGGNAYAGSIARTDAQRVCAPPQTPPRFGEVERHQLQERVGMRSQVSCRRTPFIGTCRD